MKFRRITPNLVESELGHKIYRAGDQYCCFTPDGLYLNAVTERDKIIDLLTTLDDAPPARAFCNRTLIIQ